MKQAVQVAKYGREGLEPETNVQGKEAKSMEIYIMAGTTPGKLTAGS